MWQLSGWVPTKCQRMSVLHRNRCLHQSLAFRITVILSRQVYAVTSCVNHYAYRCLFHLPFCEIFLSLVVTLSKVYGILDSAQCQFHLCLAWEHRAALCMFLDSKNPSTICRRFVCSNFSAHTWLDRVQMACSSSWVAGSWAGGCAVSAFSMTDWRSGPRTFSPSGWIRGCFLACGSQDIVGSFLLLFWRHGTNWYEQITRKEQNWQLISEHVIAVW